jgi:2-polyprenyl-3-methyl-5-hydroxy-6-metoxy-1,4-benzoquinol methylase
MLLKAIGPSRTVLDVGCNEGDLGRQAAPSMKFFGLEYRAECVEKASLVYESVQQYDLNRLEPLRFDRKFDAIVFGDVLEHVLDPIAPLKFLVENFLELDGRVVISLPNIANWQTRFGLLFGKFDYKDVGILDRTHLHFYTYKTARELVSAAGLTIVQELPGSPFFGRGIERLKVTWPLLCTNIIVVAEMPR